jgi:molybdenum cofactor cytidylyltransferase
VIVVTGHAQEAVRGALEGLPLTFAHNEHYASGLASSLQRGLACVPQDCAGALVLLGDMPLVSPAIIEQLIAAFESHPLTKAVAPVREGQRGNPVLLSRALFPAVAQLLGDVGARALLAAAQGEIVEVAVESRAVTFDVDTPDALTKPD